MTVAQRLGRAVGITEGQVYTVVTGLVAAVGLLALGLPQVGDVRAPLPAVAATRTVPLAFPGSPAVADVIAAPPTPAEEQGRSTIGAAPSDEVAGSTSLPTVGPADTAAGGGPSGGSAAREDERPAADPSPPSSGVSSTVSTPLRVAAGRYASASGPLVPGGAPGAFLPVTLRVGAPDKQSYLRLEGTGSTLRLALSSQPGHQVGEATAIRACHIIPPDWRIDDGSSLASAPAVDPVDCVLGRPSAEGWTFELAGINTANGVALVPSGPSTGTFQVTFKSGPA